jgi:transcriptional regulator with XRE-family HTH domain
MSLRRPFAAVLQLLRNRQDLSQKAISVAVAQSHVSLLETAKITATVDVMEDLAEALNVQATSFFAMVNAAKQRRTPREILLSAIAELEGLDLADEVLPEEAVQLEARKLSAAREKWRAIQVLKAKGFTQRQVADELGYTKTTVGRLWNEEPGG